MLCYAVPCLQVTLVAPWVPSSSRPPGFGGLLALLGGWTPVPLLQAFVDFTNSRVAAQVTAAASISSALRLGVSDAECSRSSLDAAAACFAW
jgi:hypothetical protein